MAYCPKCSRWFQAQRGFCPYDGTALQADEPPTEPDGLQPKKKLKIRALSALEGAAAPPRPRPDRKAEYDRLIGTTLDGRYRIERKLGEGGMGVVFLTKHTIIEKIVAIKVLKREVARDHNVVKRFVQEAKAASRIGHPNIVDVTDFGTTPDGMTYSVMEFVEGQTLGKVIKTEAPLAVARALPIAAQMAQALNAAHEKGIVHRDLKPENVFLLSRGGRRDFVKIVDFGIAKVMPLEGDGEDAPRLTRAGTVFGTPEYMAPEQAAGRSDTDRRVDVYALGTILYEMLVGKVPHKGESTVRTLAMQMLDPIPPPREVKPDLEIGDDLEEVIMHALAKKREERYVSMAVFLDDLQHASGGIPLEQPVSPSTGRVAAAPDDRTLIPLPPGADPNIVAAPGAATRREAPQAHERATVAEKDDHDTVKDARSPMARPRRPSRSDPAFLGQDAPIPLDLPFEVEEGEATVGVPRSRLWVATIATVLLLVVGGVVAAVLALRSGSGERTDRAAEAAPANAMAAAARVADAGPTPDTSIAVAKAPLDAGASGHASSPGSRSGRAGHRPGDRRGERTSSGRTLKVQVITRPEGATLYLGATYAGTGDTYISRPEGTRLHVTCRLQGYVPGHVQVVFDGVTDVYLCQLKRKKHCIKDLKNPFDDCPE